MSEQMLLLKNKIHRQCKEMVKQRIQLLQQELDQVNQAASQETKSTAGDKHETARAMMHMEREKLSRQLIEARKLKTDIELIEATSPDLSSSKSKPHIVTTKVVKGSLIQTDRGLLYLSVPLGKIQFDEGECFSLSTDSPVGKALLGGAVGDKIPFRTITYHILDVC